MIGDIDELLDWFREVETQLREAEPPSADPDVIRVQLKEHKALNDDIGSQKSRVRDVISTAKKVNNFICINSRFFHFPYILHYNVWLIYLLLSQFIYNNTDLLYNFISCYGKI